MEETQDIFLENISDQNLISGIMGGRSSSETIAGGSVDVIPDPVKDPDYMTILDFERTFPYNDWRIWMGHNWKLAVHISFIYIMFIFLGQKWMKGREPFKLDNTLRLWNLLLAAFSLVGFLRSIPEVVQMFHRPNGFYRITCTR